MAKFKVGDIIVSAKGGVRKVLSVNYLGNLYGLEVIQSKTKTIGSIYYFDITKMDAAFTLQNIPNIPKFQIGWNIQSKINTLFRCKVMAIDLTKGEYFLEVTHTTLGFSAVTSKLWQTIAIVDQEFQDYIPPFQGTTPKTNKFKTGDIIENGPEIYEIVGESTSGIDYKFNIIGSYWANKIGTKGTDHAGYIDNHFKLVSTNNKPHQIQSGAAFYQKSIAQAMFDSYMKDHLAIHNLILKCECGMDKHYQAVHHRKAPGHVHSDWCKLYKATG